MSAASGRRTGLDMDKRFEKLKALLRELFQLDRPDLDFGIYRIMRARSREVSRFLDEELLPQVRVAFEQYRSRDRAAVERELAEAIEQAEALGVAPESSPKVQELRRRLEEDAVDTAGLEAEVYDHLYRFFRRYYHEGDFISRRVYKEGVYAIPYEGEEVKLYWANHDQYYIKTSEHLRDYTFRLRPEDRNDPMRVHFKLVDAREGEHGNVKEKNRRVFVLAAEDWISEENGELVARFEYRPATLADWPEDQRAGKKRPPVQKDLLDIAEERILGAAEPSLARWIGELGKRHVKADGEEAGYTRLRAHLNRYAARNTFDYFIHKDLDGFLRRELDFYIKNEVMHLDDIEGGTAPRLDQVLSKVKVIRRIAHKIIDFLAQLEDFQKKLWLKKKFVVETFWCVTIGTILAIEDEEERRALLAEIAANEKQREEWVRMLAIDELPEANGTHPAYSEPLSVEFLEAHPLLVVDTRNFPEEFTARLLEALGDIDEKTDGLLVHGENFQALRLLQRRYAGQVGCVYIDPPYNSRTTEILYKNDYRHSSWLTLMADRIAAGRALQSGTCPLIVAIDENEQARLAELLRLLLPGYEQICVAVIHNQKGQQGRYFSYAHEYAFFCLPGDAPPIAGRPVPEEEWDYTNLRKGGRESERTTARNCFYPIIVKGSEIVGFGEVCPEDFHPPGPNVEVGDSVHVYPVDAAGVERKWRYARQSVEGIRHLLKVFRTRSGEIQIRKAQAVKPVKTVWSEPRYDAGVHGTSWLNKLDIKVDDNLYPKSIHTVADSISLFLDRGEGLVLDYFAGTGTTGHAVIDLNRQDGGRRKFILVEMADYFDTVLLPRIKKVTFTPEWKDGKPKRLATSDEAAASPRVVKCIRLESYEDTLNNLEMKRTEQQEGLLFGPTAASVSGEFREQYVLRYMLEMESRESASLLNIGAFEDPTAYRLKVKVAGSEESREVDVDLVETFNYLVGLAVDHVAAPQRVTAAFRRDDDPDLPEGVPGRLLLDGRLRAAPDGRWWFRTVAGTLPDGRRALVIWRNRPGGEDPEGMEEDNLVLEEWFRKQGYSSRDSEFDVIYVNGDNNLENARTPDETWKVHLIEEAFHRLMFETEDS